MHFDTGNEKRISLYSQRKMCFKVTIFEEEVQFTYVCTLQVIGGQVKPVLPAPALLI